MTDIHRLRKQRTGMFGAFKLDTSFGNYQVVAEQGPEQGYVWTASKKSTKEEAIKAFEELYFCDLSGVLI